MPAEITNKGDDKDMPPTKKRTAPPKVDINREAGKRALSAIDNNVTSISGAAAAGDSETAAQLERETEELISSLSGKGVAAVKASKREAVRAAKDTPAAEPMALSWTRFKGAMDRVDHAVSVAQEAVAAGKATAGKWLGVTQEVLQIRLLVEDPGTGLPDIASRSQYSRLAVGEMYQRVHDSLDQSDEASEASYRAMRNAVREYIADTTIRWLRALDEFPANQQTQRIDFIRQYFPEIADGIARGEIDSATEAVYDLYASKGVELARKTRVELRRERRQVEKVKELRAAAEDAEDDETAEQLELEAEKVAEGLPPELLEAEDEKTPQERQFERIDKERKRLERVLKSKPKTSDERRDLAERLQSFSGWLAAQAAALRED